MSFGTILKKLRQDSGLTQEELANKINTSRSNIANYENDKNMPSVDILDKLSQIFNCSIDYLMGKEEEQDLLNLSKIGFSMDKYNPPTEKQKEQIRDLLKIILKDNKKEEE